MESLREHLKLLMYDAVLITLLMSIVVILIM